MKIKLILISLTLASVNLFGQDETELMFLDGELAKKEIIKVDHYSTLDSKIRLRQDNVTVNDLIVEKGKDIVQWKEDEKEIVLNCFHDIEKRANELNINLDLPVTLNFIKSDMKTEMNAAGYTIDNTIVLNSTAIHSSYLKPLLAHEIFHVLTRYNPTLRQELYNIIGFTINDQDFEFPEDIKSKLITNPDVIRHDSYANFLINDTLINCVMAIYLKGEYNPNMNIFSEMKIALLPLDSEMKIVQNNGKTVIFDKNDAKNFDDLTGGNTSYVIDPEEVMADNFSFLMVDKTDIPNLEIPNKIKSVLKTNDY